MGVAAPLQGLKSLATRVRPPGEENMAGSAGALLALILLLAAAGCEKRGAAEPFGKTFYVGGASNIDSFDNGVASGLAQGGYRGDVQTFVWTVSFNPLIDQLVTINAQARAELLAREIEAYKQRFPEKEVNIIALSAGTGVAVWALEDLDPKVKINNLVLLGSSLSHDYDVRRALQHVAGKVYVYYSNQDAVLEAVRFVGTIDGKRGTDSAGQVGLRKPSGTDARIVNVPWSNKYLRYGWAGGHTDCINQTFVGQVIAPLMVEPSTRSTEPAQAARRPRVASSSAGLQRTPLRSGPQPTRNPDPANEDLARTKR